MAKLFNLHFFAIKSSSSSFFSSSSSSSFFLSRSLPTSHKLIKISMSSDSSLDDESYWTSIKANIKVHLHKTLPICSPLSISEPMHHLVIGAPNSLAPALCIASCELVGGQRDQAIAAASALHLMHAAIHTHNQLPLTNESKPKNISETQHLFKPNIELLCGTGMMVHGFELLAESDHDPAENEYSSERILRVMVEMSRAVGSENMHSGEYLLHQYCSTGSCENDQAFIQLATCEKKEGSLFACGAACGAILGGGSEEEIEKLRKFGLYLGMMHGLMNYEVLIGRDDGKRLREIKGELRGLALKELEGFKEEKVKDIRYLLSAKMSDTTFMVSGTENK